MSDVKITDLPVASSMADTDVLPIVAAGVTSKISKTKLLSAANVMTVYNVMNYGAKADGVTDDTAAFNAAIAAALASSAGGGTVYAPAGDYVISGTGIILNSRNVTLMGLGNRQTRLHYTGNSHCIHWRLDQSVYAAHFQGTPTVPSDSSTFGGKVVGLLIDGSGAGSTAIGIEFGDINGSIFEDVNVQSFIGSSAIGIYVHNVYSNTEETLWQQVDVINCKTCVLFDREVRVDASVTLTSGSVTFTDTHASPLDAGKAIQIVATGDYMGVVKSVSGTTVTAEVACPPGSAGVQSVIISAGNSWDYCKIYGLWVAPGTGQTGIKLQHGGQIISGILNITGNTATDTSDVFFWLADTTQILVCTVHMTIENDIGSAKGTFIKIESGAEMQVDGQVTGTGFSKDQMDGSFFPSGVWFTPSINLDYGSLTGRAVHLYGTASAQKTLGSIGSQTGGNVTIQNPCRADTCGVTNGSTTITDTAITKYDVGKVVVVKTAGSTGLGAGALLGTISSVIPGVSFVINTGLGTITTGSCTLNIAGYGIYFQPYDNTTNPMFLTFGGGLNIPATLNSAPIHSADVSVTFGSAVQNLGPDAILTCYVDISANTSLVIKAGTGSGSSSAQSVASTIITGSTTTGIVPISLYVANNYYFYISKTGTGTATIMGAMYSYV